FGMGREDSQSVLATVFLSCGTVYLLTGLCGGGLCSGKPAACDTFLITADVFIAEAFFVRALCVFLAGTCDRRSPDDEETWGNWQYSVWVLIFLLYVVGIFGHMVSTADNGGHLVAGKGYREFKLADYSSWMRQRVRDESVWEGIKQCLLTRAECQKLSLQKPDPITGIINLKFNGLQSGCCKPPDSCGFAVINASASIYEIPASASSSSSPPFAERDCS
ncbi:hypothetical protein CBR_g80998, partial [Chara braunii]